MAKNPASARMRRFRAPFLTVPQQHQLKIAIQTLRMPDEIVGVMGPPSKAEAREIIKRLTGRTVKE